VDARFVKPLDEALLCELGGRFHRIVTLEDSVLAGGFGSAVLEVLGDHGVKCDLLRMGIPDEFIEQGRIDILFDLVNMDPESIAESILSRWPELGKQRPLELRKIGQS